MLLFVMLFTDEMNVVPNTNSQLQILMYHKSQSSMVHQNVCEICQLRVTENPKLRRCVLRFSKWGGNSQLDMQTLGENNLEETDVHVRIILKSILIKQDEGFLDTLVQLRVGNNGWLLRTTNTNLTGSIKYGVFLEKLSNWQRYEQFMTFLVMIPPIQFGNYPVSEETFYFLLHNGKWRKTRRCYGQRQDLKIHN